MLDWLEPVVDVKLWCHVNESKSIDATNQCVEAKGVPVLVLLVENWVCGITYYDGDTGFWEVADGDFVVFLCLTLWILLIVFNFEIGKRVEASDLTGLKDLPDFDQDASSLAHQNHQACFVVKQIEHDYQRLEHLEIQRLHRDALHWLSTVPESDVVFKSQHFKHAVKKWNDGSYCKQNFVCFEKHSLHFIQVERCKTPFLLDFKLLLEVTLDLKPEGIEVIEIQSKI